MSYGATLRSMRVNNPSGPIANASGVGSSRPRGTKGFTGGAMSDEHAPPFAGFSSVPPGYRIVRPGPCMPTDSANCFSAWVMTQGAFGSERPVVACMCPENPFERPGTPGLRPSPLPRPGFAQPFRPQTIRPAPRPQALALRRVAPSRAAAPPAVAPASVAQIPARAAIASRLAIAGKRGGGGGGGGGGGRPGGHRPGGHRPGGGWHKPHKPSYIVSSPWPAYSKYWQHWYPWYSYPWWADPTARPSNLQPEPAEQTITPPRGTCMNMATGEAIYSNGRSDIVFASMNLQPNHQRYISEISNIVTGSGETMYRIVTNSGVFYASPC